MSSDPDKMMSKADKMYAFSLLIYMNALFERLMIGGN